jgi:poly-gamma-glutamate synthesis protein (capsule biosynthesis protein)
MTRDKALALGLALLAVGAISAVGARVAFGPGPDVVVVQASATQDGDKTTSITFAGDTLLGDSSERTVQQKGYDWPLAKVGDLMGADLFVANAEGPITTRTRWANPTADYSYNSQPEAALALARAGVDSISLANNHAMDRGPDGMADTVRYAQDAGISSFGAGDTPSAAAAPLLVDTDAGKIAIVGMGEDFGELARVSPTRPGMMVMREDRIRSAYFNARAAGADYVVAFVHWGDNYQTVNTQQRGWAQVFADAGYDLVVGTGPHVAQPIRVVSGMPVAYSIGNFVFGSNGRWADFGTEGYGVLATLVIDEQGASLRLNCLVTDNAIVKFQPYECADAEATRVLGALSPGVTVSRGVGVLQLEGFTQ